MPRTTPIAARLAELLTEQDGVVSVEQLRAFGFSGDAVYRRIKAGRWQRLLPTVLLTVSGSPTRRQLLIAAWLWAGPDAAIDGSDALRWHGVRGLPSDPRRVHVVTPWDGTTRSRSFVVVRRAMAPITISGRGRVPYVDAATAAVVAARNARTARSAVDVLSRCLQSGVTDTDGLAAAREAIGDKWCRGVDGALLAVGVGLRSPGELDYRSLVLSSRILPEPKWNQWLDLGDGGELVCVDGLWVDAGLVGEVIGKKYHAWGQQYDDTNERKERLQAAGLEVCEATPTRIRRSGPTVRANLERIYTRLAGRGMPPGVRLVPPPGWSTTPPIAC